MFKEITYYLELTFSKPVNYVATWWLSVLDTFLAFQNMPMWLLSICFVKINQASAEESL